MEGDEVVVDRVPVEHGVDLRDALHHGVDPQIDLLVSRQRTPEVVAVDDIGGERIDPGGPILEHAAGEPEVPERGLDLGPIEALLAHAAKREVGARCRAHVSPGGQ
jgi:hypothetical protein